MFEPIHFSELHDCDDSSTLVILGTLFHYNQSDIEEVEDFFHEEKLIPADAHVTDLRHIEGNVLGEEGRSDVLICFTPCNVNPMVRLRLSESMGIKWTSDFVDNYKDDYNA